MIKNQPYYLITLLPKCIVVFNSQTKSDDLNFAWRGAWVIGENKVIRLGMVHEKQGYEGNKVYLNGWSVEVKGFMLTGKFKDDGKRNAKYCEAGQHVGLLPM